MRIEISALLHFPIEKNTATKDSAIGGGMLFESLDNQWLDSVKHQCQTVSVIEKLPPINQFTHRLFCEIQLAETSSIDFGFLEKKKEEVYKLFQRAIILLRLVKPTSVGHIPFFIESNDTKLGEIHHKDFLYLVNQNIAFVEPDMEFPNTVTDEDVKKVGELWNAFQVFFEDELSPKPMYTRILRAIRFNESAYAIRFAEVAHTTLHAALESLICTSQNNNKLQIVKRLPQIIPSITEQQSEDIYSLCCDFKHSAAKWFRNSNHPANKLTSEDQTRKDSVSNLRKAVRQILLRVTEDSTFANVLADPSLLKVTYKVRNTKCSPI